MTTASNQKPFGLTAGAATGLAGLIAALVASQPVYADHPGYVTSEPHSVVRSGFGECVHTSQWTPDMRTPECGGQVAVSEPAPEPETEQAAFEPRRQVLETLTLDARTLFEFDKSTLRPDARQKLDDLAQRMQGQTQVLFINISGHADRIGDEAYNRQLSQQRAEAVADYLRNHTDLRDSKFEVRGMGESQPVVACENVSGNALINCLEPNRRVEVEVSLQRQVDAEPGSAGESMHQQQPQQQPTQQSPQHMQR